MVLGTMVVAWVNGGGTECASKKYQKPYSVPTELALNMNCVFVMLHACT